MNTSFAIRQHRQGGGAGSRRIIARTLLVPVLLATAFALAACTTARLAYTQAPHLSYWWLDSHFDFDGGQADQVRGDIDGFFAWHRREELPVYADQLRRWRAMALRDVSADEACQQFETARQRLVGVGDRLIEPFARLAPQLTPAQLDRLQKRQARSNDEFRSDFLRGTPEQRLQRRLETTVERYERFYGRLSDAQREGLRQTLAASPWDAQRTQTERERRQADLLQVLREAQAQPARARALLRGYADRLVVSPAPGYTAHSDAAIRHGCAQFAALHNSTTPAQRERAARQLQAYESDLQILSAQR